MNKHQNYTTYRTYISSSTPPEKLPRVRFHLGVGAIAIALVFLFTMAAQIILHGALLRIAPAVIENDWYNWVLSVVPMYLIAMPLSYLLMRTIPASTPRKQKIHPLMWIGFLCLCFALTYAANIIGQYVGNLIFNFTGFKVENELEEMTVSTPFLVNVLFVAILAPIFEELFYRKAVIDRLRRYGDLPAILISGLVFGLVHGNFNQFFYATAIGILLSFIYVRTGSVLYTISIHAAFNFIGGVYTTELIRRVGQELTPAEGDTMGMLMVTAYSLFTIGSLIIGAIFFIVNIISFCRSLRKGDQSLTFGQWLNVLIFNPGVLVFALVIAVLFISSLLL